ncbi:MAG TPA: hypothetical protein VF904_07920 [Anaeromyxobacteraceae bacterium]
MTRPLLLAAALLAAAPAAAFETLAVVAVADPPAGPDADLAELAHQLRAGCRDRVGGIEDVPTMRARLLGQRSNATVTELDRAYGGALAVYQNGEFESAIRTLKAIVEDLESLPESDEAYAQWVRAQLRLAHAALTIGHEKDADEAMSAVARTDPAVQPDADQYSPTYRRKFEAAKAKIRALPARKLQVSAEGFQGTVFVNGRPMGTTPLALWLPAGVYRIGGASGSLHVPSFGVDLQAEDRNVLLDFALAEALRMNAGPGLALTAADRGGALVRAGAWLAATRVVAASVVSDRDAQFLNGALYDVQRGALLREARVRMAAGSVTSVQLGALAAFLLTGQPARGVEPVRSEPVALPAPGPSIAASAPPPNLTAATALGRAPAARPGWLRPAAYAAGAVGLGLAGVATWQGIAARNGYRDADAMLRPDDTLVPGATRATHDARLASADGAKRNAYLSAAGTAVFAAAAGLLGYLSADDRGAPAVRF